MKTLLVILLLCAVEKPAFSESAPAAAPAPQEFKVTFPDSYPPRTEPWSRYRWEKVDGDHLSLVGPSGVLWRLNFAESLEKVYFHPLQTVDGRLLTWDSPQDHPWHHGLWQSWKYLNGVNYWETDPATGHPAGRTHITSVTVVKADDTGAQVDIGLEYFPAGRTGEVVMKDSIRIQVSAPDGNGDYRIDWTQETLAVEDVVLDRTPLANEPEGKSWGGYGGFSFRGAQFLKNVTFLNSDGTVGLAGHSAHSSWVSLSGTVDERPVSISMFDARQNPRSPSPWFLASGPATTGPFTYLNPALLYERAIRIKKGDTLRTRYRTLVSNRVFDSQSLDSEFQDFNRTHPSN